MARKTPLVAIVEAILTGSGKPLAGLADGTDLLTINLTPTQRDQVRWGIWYQVVKPHLRGNRVPARVVVGISKFELFDAGDSVSALQDVIGGEAGPIVSGNVRLLHPYLSAKRKLSILNNLLPLIPPEN